MFQDKKEHGAPLWFGQTGAGDLASTTSVLVTP